MARAFYLVVLLLSAATATLPSPVLANAGDACPLAADTRLLERTTGSVSMMANLRGSADSIGKVADRLLADATAATNTAPACPVNCASGDVAIVYEVAPMAFLAEENQRDECVAAEQETSASPLGFSPQSFPSLEDLNAWIMEFTRGKGAQGKDLYRRCGSNCSPRYTFVIVASASGGYRVETSTVCGLARDKSESHYALSTALRRTCTPVGAPQ